jgi:hypothetical protein
MKPKQNPIELMDKAMARLKDIGFTLAYVSMKSEACYFQYPGKKGVIRVSAHRLKCNKKKNSINGNHIISKITFNKNAPAMSDYGFKRMMCDAVGTYFIDQSPSPTPKPGAGET